VGAEYGVLEMEQKPTFKARQNLRAHFFSEPQPENATHTLKNHVFLENESASKFDK